jgi:hypothetical protein
MRAFKTKWFARLARKQKIMGSTLVEAVQRAEGGLIDADLGGGLIKQRVARQGQSRSGGFRTLIAFRSGHVAVFVYGFGKNEVEKYRRRPTRSLAGDRSRLAFREPRRVGSAGQGRLGCGA